MRVAQDGGILARPLGRSREVIPVFAAEQLGRQVEFLQLRAGAEKGTNFIPEILRGRDAQLGRALG